jgi:hypothetical protein
MRGYMRLAALLAILALVPVRVMAAEAAAARREAGAKYGSVHFPVSCSPAAQAQFDEAVGMLHSFFYPETVKVFTRVAEIDPSCAMAQWGIAISLRPNPFIIPIDPALLQRGWEAIQKGKALGPKTQRERDWLEALEPYFQGADKLHHSARVKLYEAAMERLWQHHPDDAEAGVFYALAMLEAASPLDKSYSSQFRAAKLLEKLAAGRLEHPGIAHYLIHAYDYSPIAGKGLEAANAYARIAPDAPHAQHMPAHIYSMLGMWKPSVESNGVAIRVSRAYSAKNFPGAALVQEPHALDFVEYAYLQLGMDREAKATLAEAAAIQKTNIVSLAAETALAAIPVRDALERGAWAEAAALVPRASPYAYAEAIGHYGRALGAARLGGPSNLARARAEIEKLGALRASYLAKPDQAYWAEQTQVLVESASAWLARAEGNDSEALRLLRAAADLEDASEKHVAMENRLFPVREQLGFLLLELRQPQQALAELRASLKSSPNRLRGLFGAAQASELAGYRAEAVDFRRRLRELTAQANGERPEIAYARAPAAGPN